MLRLLQYLLGLFLLFVIVTVAAFIYLKWWQALIVVLAMTFVVMYLTYGERKVVARFQQRLGPTKTGPAGLLQALADAIIILGSLDIVLGEVDK